MDYGDKGEWCVVPKIRNWSREYKDGNETVWTHDSKDVGLEILYHKDTVANREDGMADIWLVSSISFSNRDFPRKYDTREEARKWAVNWMKKHPMERDV